MIFTSKHFSNYLGPTAAAIMADIANEKVKEWLSKAPVVHGYIHDDGYILMDSGETGSVKAKLVCIEDNTKEKK